jgi:iron complex transport system substrate-binding protein
MRSETMKVATLSEMLEEVVHLGEATGTGEEAHELRGELEGRLATVRAAVAGATVPRVIAIERLYEPVRVAGLWVPEMIAIAGGQDVAGSPGLSPAEVSWGELAGLRPEVVIVMVEGYLEDVQAQAMEVWEHLESLGAARVYAVAAQSGFSDPGPRLIDGVELTGHLLHPDLMDPPGNTPFTLLRSPAPRTARM